MEDDPIYASWYEQRDLQLPNEKRLPSGSWIGPTVIIGSIIWAIIIGVIWLLL